MRTARSETLPSNCRSSRRKGVRCALLLLLPERAAQQAMTLDVGADGLSFQTARPIAPGTKCQISFELPLGGRSLLVNTQVKAVYSSYGGTAGFRIGGVFTTIDPDCRAALREFADS